MREGSKSLGRVTGRTQLLIKAEQGPSTVGRMELAGRLGMAWEQAALSWLLMAMCTGIQRGHYSDQEREKKREREIKINVFSFRDTLKMRNTSHFLF